MARSAPPTESWGCPKKDTMNTILIILILLLIFGGGLGFHKGGIRGGGISVGGVLLLILVLYLLGVLR